MAIRFPISSGNWSNTAIWSGSLTPTTADDVHANGFTVTIDQNVTVLSLKTTASGSAAAGGGFLITGSQTVTCTATNGIVPGSTNALVVSGSSDTVITLNSSVVNSTTTSNVVGVLKSGLNTLNVNGSLFPIFFGGGNRDCLLITNSGSVNVVGSVTGTFQALGIRVNTAAGGFLNITGDINPGKSIGTSDRHVEINQNTTINVTGNIYGGGGGGAGIFLGSTASTLTITGNVYGGSTSAVQCTGNVVINATGALFAQHTAGSDASAISSTSTSAINIFTGPFIYSPYGAAPYYVYRMHLKPILNNYIQFRDSSTSGSLSPGPTASIARFVSADTVISDQPIPANVRSGVVYGSGAYTGTMIVPNSANVRLGIPVDNTTGSAVLSVQDIWNYPVQNMTSSNSVGNLLKNVSTVGITGDQIAAFVV